MATTEPTLVPADVLEAARKAWVVSDGWQIAVAVAYRHGLAAGRTAAAADPLADDVARAAVAWRAALVTEGEDIGEVEGALFHLAERYEVATGAARVAENGADQP